MRWLCCLCVLCFKTLPLLAVDEASPTEQMPSYEGTFFRMILMLVGLLSFVLLTIWALKKLSHGRFGSLGTQKRIVIVEKKSVSPKTLLYLIELDGKKILLSESQLEVRMLLQPQEEEDYN
ncbi:MAG: hypothetical protein FJZ58_05120 [Chlamydiae bacterium]|nr:hypothetical protein [Chlamydiota bacterium]